MNRPIAFAALAAASLTLSGCGGDDDNDLFRNNFFARQPAGTTATYDGVARETAFSRSAGGELSSSNFTPPSEGALVDIRLDSLGNLVGIEVDGSTIFVSMDDDFGSTDVDTDGRFWVFNRSDAGIEQVAQVANPAAQGLTYHSYGAWVELVNDTSGRIGAAAFADPVTAPADVPTSGSATYEGRSAGFFVDEVSDRVLATRSEMTADVNFGSDQIDFRTEDTIAATEVDGDYDIDARDLDTSGTLVITGSGFSGAVSAGTMTGSASGIFAGSDAQEMGGTLYVSDSDGAYAAGFGGRR